MSTFLPAVCIRGYGRVTNQAVLVPQHWSGNGLPMANLPGQAWASWLTSYITTSAHFSLYVHDIPISSLIRTTNIIARLDNSHIHTSCSQPPTIRAPALLIYTKTVHHIETRQVAPINQHRKIHEYASNQRHRLLFVTSVFLPRGRSPSSG